MINFANLYVYTCAAKIAIVKCFNYSTNAYTIEYSEINGFPVGARVVIHAKRLTPLKNILSEKEYFVALLSGTVSKEIKSRLKHTNGV